MFERIMGLNVIDDDAYAKYREGMTPILHSYNADFGYDFIVSKVLKSKATNNINRVFTIDFPSESVMNSFFEDVDYIAIKKKYLDHAVDSKTVISMHEKHSDDV